MNGVVLMGVWLSIFVMLTLAEYRKYSNIWVTKVRGGEEVAKRVARDLGYNYKGQLGQFKDYYKLVREDHPEVSLRDSDHLTYSLLDLDEVVWAKQQMLVRPKLRGLENNRNMGLWQYTEEGQREKVMTFLKSEAKKNQRTNGHCARIFSCITTMPTSIYLFFRSRNQGDVSQLGSFSTKPASSRQVVTVGGYSQDKVTKPIGLLSKKLSAYALRYNDPYWEKQWYMQDYRTVEMPVMDLNVVPVHEMGITGKGVTVAIVDSGVEHGCPEIKNNFIADLSYDVCMERPGCDPSKGRSHGTYCAGIVAMQPNNNLCGVGIAYDAKIIGTKVLCDYDQPEFVFSRGLIHNFEHYDVSSNSWGWPSGKEVHDLYHLDAEALTLGTTKGRDGKGVIYVRSAGNGRHIGDTCATDGDINTELSIAITSADQWGRPAYYSERCTAVLAATYSGSHLAERIVAPGLKGGCEADFTGNSAACPQASAIIALALQANPMLTYRDVMHLITMSAEVAPLADNDNIWYKNGRGFWVSNDFGFGLMNAENMVNLAKTWENVPQKSDCIETILIDPPEMLSYHSGVSVTFEASACKGKRNEINYLEHIELASIVSYRFRGQITISLTSPSGTTSQLLQPRYRDTSRDGLNGWSIMSTHNWGENPRGEWTVSFGVAELLISRVLRKRVGQVRELTLRFHGTRDMPAHYRNTREYAAFRLPNGKTSL